MLPGRDKKNEIKEGETTFDFFSPHRDIFSAFLSLALTLSHFLALSLSLVVLFLFLALSQQSLYCYFFIVARYTVLTSLLSGSVHFSFFILLKYVLPLPTCLFFRNFCPSGIRTCYR